MKASLYGGIFSEDRLVRQFNNGKSHGKRVSKSCPLTSEERRLYVRNGTYACLSHMMKSRNLPLADAWGILKRARGRVKMGIRQFG